MQNKPVEKIKKTPKKAANSHLETGNLSDFNLFSVGESSSSLLPLFNNAAAALSSSLDTFLGAAISKHGQDKEHKKQKCWELGIPKEYINKNNKLKRNNIAELKNHCYDIYMEMEVGAFMNPNLKKLIWLVPASFKAIGFS